ncbi:ABC transporter substrate-binding protein [Paenibacillus thiaminolyticus]|uniref:ABC transporter substrate-binding protein n=1 Tax=Paenibacillus thiaminolyticus TaxID=49283 RepID=A0AAP9DYR4_PANTH|nr:ABC transporter substrate-binding protein [Paenibacillus thiaminolyticus]MCY9538427.1 ABC transporter substrate-binding protein [Paenibacillus thiaminolyticus]MCY9604338.1 ABC transporter substrate-binding protein [Paenibacillus thiaminolyticus]MCY9609564.1 ABC transporter substrate-binding protein [Paenibacillus thiaminolyticus]MCY9616044.1 ABC transporter substrate-binding protein [Paenibacillus thiaminolyticus]MCY9621437.1 ABC transporter substrate-binding protein [Paenibacillus thiamino
MPQPDAVIAKVMKKTMILALSILLAGFSIAGCSSSKNADANTSKSSISGDIVVITNDAGSIDTLFKDYEKRFKEKYPEVNSVRFEAVQDYDNNMRTRMSTKNYGDVLYNPNLSADKFAQFYEPLGTVEDMKQKYTFAERGAYDGQVYMLPVSGDVSGIMYNKKVFEQAGITEWPTTVDEFMADMRAIKEKTSAIPYYSNYNAGWPLSQWKGNEAVIANDSAYRNQTLPHDPEPFAAGKPNYILYHVLYDLTKEGLIEADPTTSDFDKSLQMIANGQIGSMALGSWALSNARSLADNPDDVGFMPFPNADHKAMLNAGYGMAVNVNSKNKATAKAFVEFFITESGYAEAQGNVPGVVGGKVPESLNDMEKNNVEFMVELPSIQGEEGLVEEILSQSEVGLYDEKFGRRIIDTALGRSQEGFTSFDDIVNRMNQDWSNAQKEVFAKRNIQ